MLHPEAVVVVSTANVLFADAYLFKPSTELLFTAAAPGIIVEIVQYLSPFAEIAGFKAIINPVYGNPSSNLISKAEVVSIENAATFPAAFVPAFVPLDVTAIKLYFAIKL